MVREINGLRALQMRVAGNEHVGIFLAERDEGALQIGNFAEQQNDFIAQPEPHVERDLVVARAGGVQFRAGGNALGQFGLDVHVDVFELGLPLEFAGGDFLADLIQAFGDGAQFILFQHADFLEHRRVGDGAGDVVPPQAPVEGNGFGELRDVGGGAAGETSAAGNGRFFIHVAAPLKPQLAVDAHRFLETAGEFNHKDRTKSGLPTARECEMFSQSDIPSIHE